MVKKPFQNQLGKLLKAARKECRLTQTILADKADISVPTLRLLEQGRGRLSSWTAVLIALGLELRGLNLPQSETVGKSIVLLRKRRSLGQRVVAQAAGISKPTLIALEKQSSGTLSSLDQVLTALGAGPRLVKVGSTVAFYSNAAFSSAFQNWETPKWLLEKLYIVFGRFDLDPCSPTRNSRRAPVRAKVRFTEEDDALSLAWFGNVFMNPPYGRELSHWTAKANGEFLSGNAITIVGLIPARTDTIWWHRDIASQATVFFLKGRLSFGKGGQSAPFPSALVIWSRVVEWLEGLKEQFPEAQVVDRHRPSEET